jgi:hypothetical protein
LGVLLLAIHNIYKIYKIYKIYRKKDLCANSKCNDNQYCNKETGKCVCKKGYSGKNCNNCPSCNPDNPDNPGNPGCEPSCNSNQNCDETSKKCICKKGYSGKDCSVDNGEPKTPGLCENVKCAEFTDCDPESGKCKCNASTTCIGSNNGCVSGRCEECSGIKNREPRY